MVEEVLSVLEEVVERELLRDRALARARIVCAASERCSMDTEVLGVSYFS